MKFITNKIQSIISGSIDHGMQKGVKINDPALDSLLVMQQKQLFILMREKGLDINEAGFSVFSESDEDGLLLYIFSKVGFTNKVCVDIGGGNGLQGSNIANLILHHGFFGLILEGEKLNADALRNAYAVQKATKHFPPVIKNTYASIDNINLLINSNGITGDIDLLSIDIDSIDYWIWEALTVVSPSVVIVEIQCILGAEASRTVPPDFKQPVFETFENKRYGIYNSASLLAFVKLGESKGYRLVATSQLGFNAIFIKKGLAVESIPTISVEQGLDKPFVKWAREKFGEKTKALPWIEV